MGVLLRWGATFSLMHKSNRPCNRVVSQWQAAAANRQPLPTHLRGTPPLFAPPTASSYRNQLSLCSQRAWLPGQDAGLLLWRCCCSCCCWTGALRALPRCYVAANAGLILGARPSNSCGAVW